VEEGKSKPSTIRYGEEVEERIEKITELVEDVKFRFPARWTAIKLLEGDERVEEEIRRLDPSIMDTVTRLSKEIEEIHGHSCPTVITSERYDAAARISREVQSVTSRVKTTARERLHTITTSRISGYPIMALVIIGIFEFIFTFGNFMSQLLSNLFYSLEPSVEAFLGTGLLKNLVWGGIAEGIIASVTVALPYIAPFYFILHILEDSGYMSRIAFLMDSFMHKIGLHGKAFIPIMLGYGCTVPACLGCRILETRRERLIAAFVVTMIPCAARTVIILGLVGAFVGIWWAIALYVFNLIVVFLLGRLAFKALPGEPTALIMEMSEYKLPHLKTVGEMTWFDLKEFVKISFPLIIVGSLVLKALEAFNLLAPIAEILSPVTVSWLQLPLITGVALIFGVLRKELTLVMLSTLAGTTNFSLVLTPVQMVVFTLVVMFYVPCVATITALVKETGYKKAFLVTVFEIAFALLIGGLASRILTVLGVP
jgi:ferrous iron transport protein B